MDLCKWHGIKMCCKMGKQYICNSVAPGKLLLDYNNALPQNMTKSYYDNISIFSFIHLLDWHNHLLAPVLCKLLVVAISVIPQH